MRKPKRPCIYHLYENTSLSYINDILGLQARQQMDSYVFIQNATRLITLRLRLPIDADTPAIFAESSNACAALVPNCTNDTIPLIHCR